MTDIRKIFVPTQLKVILTVMLILFFFLYNSIGSNLMEIIFFIIAIYVFSCVSSFFWYVLKNPYRIRAICFDLGGVYFEGEYLTQSIKSRYGMNELIKKLKKKYVIAALTNQNSVGQEGFSKKFKLNQVFDYVIISSRIRAKKPDALFFKKSAEIMRVSPNEMIFFDDSQENVEGAKSIGVKTFVFTSVQKAKNDLKNIGIKI